MGLLQSRNRLIGGTDSDLLDAVEEGHTAVVEALLAQPDIDVNATTPRGNTALIKAARNGHTAIVELLLAAGANVNAKDEDGYTALIDAASHAYIDLVRLLLAAGANVNANNDVGGTALIKAASYGFYGDAEVVRLLLDAGADVNAMNNWGETALMLAEQRGHTGVVRAIERFIAEQAMNRWIPRHRDRVGFGEFVGSTRVRRRRRNSAGYVEDVEIDRLPRRAQTFIKGFL